MSNYFIANGSFFIALYIFIVLCIVLRCLYGQNTKLTKKKVIIISVFMLILFTILTIMISITDYNRWGNTRFLDAKARLSNSTMPKAIKTGIICVFAYIGRLIYIKFIKRRK